MSEVEFELAREIATFLPAVHSFKLASFQVL